MFRWERGGIKITILIKEVFKKFNVNIDDIPNEVLTITVNEDLKNYKEIEKNNDEIIIKGEYLQDDLKYNIRVALYPSDEVEYLFVVKEVEDNFGSMKVYDNKGLIQLIS